MQGVLIGFAIIGTVILIGYLTGRSGVLGDTAPHVISRFTFFVLSPCLLFTVLADSDVHVLFSSMLAVSSIAAVLACLLFLGIALLVFRRSLPEAVIGALSAGYVNANNIGIPVAVYVLGDPAWSAPVILFQLLVLAPIALTVLDVSTNGRGGPIWRILLKPFTNPLIIGSALGALVAIAQLEIPAEIMEPFRIVGAAAVPLVLINFGMSLHGQRPLAPGSDRRDVLLATAIKLAVMPLIAWLFGRFVFGMDGEQLFVVVVLAALPTAQNIFVYAQRYNHGQVVSRDVILLTTVGAVPILVGVAALLAV
ncbi:AEC family transporter [Glaciihabitans arcticus]|uniref:AEC family transporter n=1 Tax=Glaciihabitans arcticus TaxID=2668039 RepID=A0A4Q9H061_9MICO|nr:AEC family transporter [Glaciihabitans arcticus]TBN58070.1 AEC family transporter [Glaciihabitans arcticus]